MHLCLVLPISTGGIGRHVRTVVDALTARQHDVTVIAPATDDVAFGFSSAGARFVAAPVGAGSPRAVARVRSVLVANCREVDVVHVHGVRAAASLLHLHSVPIVATWHNAPIGSKPRRSIHAGLERAAARAARVTICASEDLVERARRAGARDARFVPVVAPLAPVIATRPDQETPPGYFLAIARLAAQKRLDVLIRAAAGWADEPGRPRVLIAGDGPLRGELSAQALTARAPIEFLGQRDDVTALLAGARAVVLVSDWEARPLALQEALRAGVPVVATAVGGVPGLLAGAGVLIPPGDPAALRKALDEISVDAKLRARLAAASLVRAGQLPGAEDMIDELLGIYAAARGH